MDEKSFCSTSRWLRVQREKGEIHEISDLFGMSEYLYIALLLWLGACGAGPVSLDRVFAKRLGAAASK